MMLREDRIGRKNQLLKNDKFVRRKSFIRNITVIWISGSYIKKNAEIKCFKLVKQRRKLMCKKY